jgi:exopolysaccharide biosynthesis polyprenyl glycosylphosphotransferase
MLKRQKQLRTQFQKLLDGGLFGLSLWLAHSIRAPLPLAIFGGTPEIMPFETFKWPMVALIIISPLLLEIQGFYNRSPLITRGGVAWQVFKASICAVIALTLIQFLLRQNPARSVNILFGPVAFLVMMCKEELLKQWLTSKLGRAQLQRRIIVVGTREDTARVLADLDESGSDTFKVVSQINLNVSSIDDLVEALHEHSANGVLLTGKHTMFGMIEKAIQACELEGVEAWLVADFFNTQVSQTSIDDFNGRPLLVFRSTPEESWQKLAKQCLDAVGALLFLTLCSPIFVLVAIAVKMSSPGPVFFKQTRSGLNGKPFTMLKFRSMVSNAEQRKAELEQLNEMSGPVFKLTNDPRVTRVGRFLRKWSIDEWPQMFNVLLGEMSMVGPRPLPVDEVKRFDHLSHRRRLSVKPGLTCLWQIKGRNNVKDFKDWVRLDLEYIDNWSLWLDCKILVKTIPVVLMGTGAK